jgi:hypothetical protein
MDIMEASRLSALTPNDGYQARVMLDLLVPAPISLPTGVWTPVYARRKALLRFPKTTLYSIYVFPGQAAPPDIAHAHNVTSNDVSLYGAGWWMVYHATGSAITGILMDAGAGEIGLETSGSSPAASVIDSILISPLTQGTPALTAVTTTAANVLAANTARRGVYLKNTSSTAGQTITYRFGGTAVALTGFVLEPGDSHSWGPLDRIPTGAVNAISSSGSPNLAIIELT